MKKNRICPECGKTYDKVPALSRKDDKTDICADCGVRQALEMFGIVKEKIEEILVEMHKNEDELGQK